MKKELIEYLKEEENHAFTGWDFSYLKGRWYSDEKPWSYSDIVKKHLKNTSLILDMGTGGGELLLSFNHPFDKTSVTEAYEKNIELCLQTLKPKGIKVYPIKQDDILLDVPTDTFNIVLNNHESYKESEVKRVLKDNGLFITEQVGAYNDIDLIRFFDPNYQPNFPLITLDKSIERLKEEGFEILYYNECFPTLKFFDLGAIAFFSKIISWEFINFSVDKYLDKFEELDLQLKKNGYIKATEHRFIIVARKTSTHKMNLVNDAFTKIKNKQKTIEMRLNDEKRTKIKINDSIIFKNLKTNEEIKCVVTNLHHYSDFRKLYENHNKISIGYEENEMPDYQDMFKYYSQEQIDKYGVLGIEIKVNGE